MNFLLKEGKTNWKYILIVVISALIVGVGTLWWVKKQKVSFVEFPEIEKPEKVEDETANWETYRNDDIGFLMKYPSDWEVGIFSKGEYGAITFDHRDELGYLCSILVSKSLNYDDERGRPITFEEMVTDLETKGEEIVSDITGQGVRNLSMEQIIIDNIPAIKLCWLNDYGDRGCIVFSVLEKDIFSINHMSKSKQEKCQNTFNQILSTFRFIKIDETSNWKIYRNEGYGFEVKYPTEYTLEENVEKMTDFGEEGDYAEILLNKTIIDSPCYKSSVQKVYIGINETDNTSTTCSKEKVFAPTLNEEYIKGISLQLTEEGWSERKEINDIIFYRRYFVTHSMGGKAYPNYAYQSFRNKKCYKIGLEGYSSSAFGFTDECPPSLRDSSQYESLFENEDKKIQETFFPILSTFRFLE